MDQLGKKKREVEGEIIGIAQKENGKEIILELF